MLANSYFTPAGQADNWAILGPITIPASGAILSWKDRVYDPAFKDGYEVKLTTTGDSSINFTSPAIFTLADNAPALDTIWKTRTVSIDTSYAGQLVYIAIHHTATDMFILGIDKIMITEAAGGSGATFDECIGATDINSGFGQAIGAVQTLGPYDNSAATVSATDPLVGWDCYGEPDGTGTGPELNNNVWFAFTGDGNNYFVESSNCAGVTNYIDDGDTQFSLYSGSCSNLSPIKCNEDGPSATSTTYPAGFSFGTTVGTTYYLMVDGFSFNGAVSSGEFCLKITQQQTITCTDASITTGILSQTNDTICDGDSISVTATGAISSNTGQYSGMGWVITTADITGSTDPLNDPSFVTSYAIQSPVPATSTRKLVNDGAFIGTAGAPYGVYYWTPVVFGNATEIAPNPVFLQDLVLDPSCTESGQSLMALIADPLDPACLVGFEELNNSNFSISSLYPVPVKDKLNFTVNTKKATVMNITINDVTGRVMHQSVVTSNTGSNKVSIPTNAFAAGVYTVTVNNGNGASTSKFVKQ